MTRGGAAVMLQGTGSDVGKSVLVAGLCRAYRRRGLEVRPFKPQNMSNNAAVTSDGGEIGRAQALQARACGVPPSCDMNPVLLKPQGDHSSQIIVQGRMRGAVAARDYWREKAGLMPPVLESFARLRDQADLVLVEGAGSPAEINLRAGDIANMGFAAAADLPVVLVGDIERGGVIAAIVGTEVLLEDHERDRIKAFIINKFRGDVSLFSDALEIISERTGFAPLGIVPFIEAAGRLPAEDSLNLRGSDRKERCGDRKGEPRLKIVVPRLPRIANFDDFDPLLAETAVDLVVLPGGEALPGDCDLVVLPGSKATLSDLAFLRAQGWDLDIAAHLRRGGGLLGICAGFQMLGTRVRDPDGIEGPPGEAPGLGLLELETVLTDNKTLTAASGRIAWGGGQEVTGYEMHVGASKGPAMARPMLELAGRPDGARSADGRVQGCYLHGLFAADAFRRAFLEGLCPGSAGDLRFEQGVENALDSLADELEAALDLDYLLRIARGLA